MDMKMIIPGDKHDFSDDIGLFNLDKIKNKSVSYLFMYCLLEKKQHSFLIIIPLMNRFLASVLYRFYEVLQLVL